MEREPETAEQPKAVAEPEAAPEPDNDRDLPDFSALGGRDIGAPPPLRLDVNNGPEPPPGFVPALTRRLQALHRYGPETAEELRTRLADALSRCGGRGVTADNVVVGAGSMTLLRLAVEEARAARRHVIAQVPGYAGFRRLCAALDTPLITVPRSPDFGTNEEALRDAILGSSASGAMVYLNHPVNPIGVPEDLASIDRLLAEYPDTVILIDEAYAEFHEGPGALATSVHAGSESLIVTRSFSKARALAGIRLGYAVTGTERARRWRSAMLPGSVSALTQAAALAALDEHPDDFDTRMRRMRAERDRLAAALQPTLGAPLPATANFLTFPMGPRTAQVVAQARTNGIAIRAIEDEPGLPSCVRITVGTREENDRLVAVLADASH